MSADLECPACHESATQVIDTRNGPQLGLSIRRRRKCLHCGARFTTYEQMERRSEVHRVVRAIKRVLEAAHGSSRRPRRTKGQAA
jgi:transcriptional regulator NrdR family protein